MRRLSRVLNKASEPGSYDLDCKMSVARTKGWSELRRSPFYRPYRLFIGCL